LVSHTKGGVEIEGVENKVLRRLFGPKGRLEKTA
jgi:hypothetical protein